MKILMLIFAFILFAFFCCHHITPLEIVEKRDECIRLNFVPHELVDIMTFRIIDIECGIK